MKNIFKYFFRGSLLLVPIGLTIYLVFVLIVQLDDIIYGLVPSLKEYFPVLEQIHGLGLLVIVPTLTLVGYFVTNFLANSVLEFIESIMVKIPLIGFIYSSLKDLMSALVGDDRKFNKPVLVTMSKENNIRKLGFVTKSNLTSLNMEGFVGVYLPHSYAFSGNLFIVPLESITPLDANGTDIYKLIVSGGVAGLDDDNKSQFLLEFKKKHKE